MNMTLPVKQIYNSVQQTCNFIQVSGPTLTMVGNNYTLNQPGEVVIVYYADITRTYNGNTISYRVYSEPVTITFSAEI